MITMVPGALRYSAHVSSILALRMSILSALIVGAMSTTSAQFCSGTMVAPAMAQDEEQPGNWIEMAPSGARATFKMPKKPRYVEKIFTPLKNKPPLKLRLHLATVADGKLSYAFVYHDMHERPKDKKAIDDALAGAVKGSVANVLGQLIDAEGLDGMKSNPEKISKDSYPGRLFICRFMQNKKRYIVTGHVFLIDKRLYQLNCIMAEEIFDPFLAAKFLRSFKFTAPDSDLPPRPRPRDTLAN